MDDDRDVVFRVELATGNRAIVSKKDNRGTGTPLSAPAGLAFHNGFAYVTDDELKAVAQVELSSGNCITFSKKGARGSGPAFMNPTEFSKNGERGSGLSFIWPESVAFYDGTA